MHCARSSNTVIAVVLGGAWLALSCSSDGNADAAAGAGRSGQSAHGAAANGGAGSGGRASSAGSAGYPGSAGTSAGQTAGVSGGRGGRGGEGPSGAQAGQSASERCTDDTLTWKTANKTNYTSYPEPGSEECIEFSGCKYQGMFAACDDTKSEDWVSRHNIVAIFPDLDKYQLHDLCLSKTDGSDMIIVTVYDTCADSDCDGCCTQNRGSAEALIDVEHYTNERWGVSDGPIKWADLGHTNSEGCDSD